MPEHNTSAFDEYLAYLESAEEAMKSAQEQTRKGMDAIKQELEDVKVPEPPLLKGKKLRRRKK